ncbi:hypothetical protein N8368_03410, partial [Bacteroidia bacterium]|nr:hypothetical protein [Bacteroidia bacterium]
MKKYILSISILVVLLMGSALFLPYLFKDKIIELVKTEANKGLKPKLDFAPNIGINIFKSFPNLNLTLNDVSLIHQDSAFSNDTFMSAKKLEVSFDLMKFYKEQQYVFRSIAITQPLLHLESNIDQRVNWDTMKDSSTEEASSETLTFELAKVDVTNGRFEYIDNGTSVKILGLDHHSYGNFNSESFILSTITTAREVKLISGGIAYLNNWEVKQEGDIKIDLANNKYSLPNNSLVINGLPASLDGSLVLSDDDILFDFETNSITKDLNKFLTLIPAIYTSDYANMKTKGAGTMSASFKGKYGENSFPAYDLKLLVDDGWFKYPELPLPAEDINLNLHVYSKTGNTDRTVIDIPKLHFKLADDPFDATLNMQDIFGNSVIDAKAIGRIDLANLLKLIPLEGTQLTGLVDSDVEIKGRIKDISNSAIDKFKASGNLKTTNLIYQTEDLNEQLVVNNADIGVYNQKIAISSFDGMLGKNDIKFSGTFDNFFSYLLKDETLTGKASLTSKNLNANDFLAEEETIADDSEVQMT